MVMMWKNRSPFQKRMIFGGIHRLSNNKNIQLAIISFGYKDAIIEALRRVNLLTFFNQHAIKSFFIQYQYKDIPAKNRMFIDNDWKSNQQMMNQLLLCQCGNVSIWKEIWSGMKTIRTISAFSYNIPIVSCSLFDCFSIEINAEYAEGYKLQI